ncbi:hypothetical protein CcaverHIS002_0608440 [Cutaneotrichosporon cavernicola]|uniref:F-box domain-containing protein n=1 Tax=Cutaneotrichosporon cavernicola TaxID=279322 RepID=A0AA48L9D6_9TREE|nr:uncharacterized protein CcaverHIS019_0607890 [Cutaneotrichosporon cavernicola]BEI86557.1 hypothetical protein CcaverHIS002_0608440 [Cutaneotrichosporon cavernicola]BEI94330.1 hypothetical protein CcaverHIS019_0607890 [Cutaneotrichosporon cavernicola]BEJ02107.1 hypothetical protein CcaverHIS631_0607890 [Cutaneotrichosporon cavernicola]BEJ09869.1 hypothetical protein CcaverHIS641_0607840 [Cutaneotrichosporon cavernicola]
MSALLAALSPVPLPTPSQPVLDGRRLPLPPEILVFALQSLPTADLASCLRVNSGFAHLSLPLLYQHVRLGDRAWPGYDDASISGPLSLSRPTYLSLAQLVHRTRTVDIYSHSTTRCTVHTLPPLPNVAVIRLFLGTVWSGRRIYHTDANPFPSPCSALCSMHAPKLVVHGLTLAHSRIPHLPRSLESSVNHLVAVFEPEAPFILPRNGLAAARTAAAHFRATLPENTLHLTLVFRRRNWRNWRNCNTTLSWALVHAYASALWAQVIGWVCKGGRLTIVNVGALTAAEEEETPCAADCAALQAAIRRYFAVDIAERMGDDAGAVLENLAFWSMDQFLALEEADDVFDADE